MDVGLFNGSLVGNISETAISIFQDHI